MPEVFYLKGGDRVYKISALPFLLKSGIGGRYLLQDCIGEELRPPVVLSANAAEFIITSLEYNITNIRLSKTDAAAMFTFADYYEMPHLYDLLTADIDYFSLLPQNYIDYINLNCGNYDIPQIDRIHTLICISAAYGAPIPHFVLKNIKIDPAILFMRMFYHSDLYGFYFSFTLALLSSAAFCRTILAVKFIPHTAASLINTCLSTILILEAADIIHLRPKFKHLYNQISRKCRSIRMFSC